MKKRTLLGLITSWIFIYIVLFMFWGLGFIKVPIQNIIMPLHLLTWGISLYLIYSYIKNVLDNTKITTDKKIAWIAFIFFLSPLAMIIYFFIHGSRFDISKMK